MIDSDDIAYSDRLQKQYNFLEKYSEIGCLGTKVKGIGNLADRIFFPAATEHKDIELCLVFNGCVFCHSTVMLRKEILDKNNISYNTDFVPAEDYALWLDLVGLTQFAVLDECLGEYRFYSDNISNKQSSIQYKKGNEIRVNASIKYLGIHDLDKNIWDKFLLEKELNIVEIKHINYMLPQVIKVLSCKGYTDRDICNLFKNHFRKLFYHVRSVLGQWLLLTSPLNSYFGMKIHWRLFCFVCRGLFSINKGVVK